VVLGMRPVLGAIIAVVLAGLSFDVYAQIGLVVLILRYDRRSLVPILQ